MTGPAATPAATVQVSTLAAERLYQHLATFLAPIPRILDQRLERRLVALS